MLWVFLETNDHDPGFHLRFSDVRNEFTDNSVVSLNSEFLGQEFLVGTEQEQLAIVVAFAMDNFDILFQPPSGT